MKQGETKRNVACRRDAEEENYTEPIFKEIIY
jgi:hypothetical protein